MSDQKYPPSNPYLTKKIIERQVLSLGNFVLNSGQVSQYYYNFGKFSDSLGLKELGFAFHEAIKFYNLEFDVLFGASYKGIVPCLATAYYMLNNIELGVIVPWAFNRKETKQHGEGGDIIGTPIQDKKILLLDDVYTTGKALRKTVESIKREGGSVSAILVAVNRSTEFIEHLDDIPIFFITSHLHILQRFQ